VIRQCNVDELKFRAGMLTLVVFFLRKISLFLKQGSLLI
jgi:hypothetical protein